MVFVVIIQSNNTSAASAPAGIIIPLYSYPGPIWDELIKEKIAHPSVPIIAIINPDSGPGTSINSNYVTGVKQLQSVGITVLGYVYTSYGARSADSIDADVSSYYNWYHVNGINFDEMSNKPGFETFYKHLNDYAKSIGLKYTIGNPGTDTLPSYIGTVDNLMIYDNPGLPPLASFAGWYANYDKSNFSIVSYEIDNLNSTYIESVTHYVQYVYISNTVLPNPFTSLPTYLDNLLSLLDTENQPIGIQSAVKSSSQNLGTLEIDLMSVSGDRADFHGLSLKVYQDNANTPFQVISSLSGNPYVLSLPLGHRYKIESYASDMLASIGYVNLDTNNEKLELGIPVPGSLRFTVLYNDGITPINNATVMVKSTDGAFQYWTNSTTDNVGDTIRFWLQPTISNDNYYVANVFLKNALLYSYYPISVLPGLSANLNVVTPWPAVLPPVTVSVYKSSYQKVSKADGDFTVQLYDGNGGKISESRVDAIGETTFSNLPVGKYVFRVVDLSDTNNKDWNATNVILDGKQDSVKISKIVNYGTNQGDILSDPSTSVSQTPIPAWVRNDAKWWSQNQVNDSDFVSGIQYLIQEKIMKIPPTHDPVDSSSQIPPWIKSNAGWWAQGQISDGDFIKGIQYLISSGIMKISNDSALLVYSQAAFQIYR